MARRRAETSPKHLDPIDVTILGLHRGGRSARAIAVALRRAGTPLGKTAIADRLSRLSLEGVAVRRRRKRPSARTSAASASKTGQTTNGAAVPSPAAATLAAFGLTQPSSELPPDTGDADIDTPRVRLRSVRSAIDAAIRGELPITSLPGLIRVEADLRELIANQGAPAASNGEANHARAVEAGEVRAELETAVAAAEHTVRCVHCGANPFQLESGNSRRLA